MSIKTIFTKTVLIAGFSVMATGCTSGAPDTQTVAASVVNVAETETSLNRFNDEFNAISAKHDVDGLLSLYTPDSLWIAPGERPATGYEEPRKTFSFLAENKGLLTHTVDHLHISNDGSQAVMIGEAVIKVDAVGMDATGTYLFVMKRVNDEWKIVTDMFHQHTK